MTIKINLDKLQLYTATEASRILNKDDSYIRQVVNRYPDRLPEGSYRKFGKTIIVTQDAINALNEQPHS